MERRTIMVTGATSGIGRSIANLFSNKDWNLVLIGRKKEALAELQKEYNQTEVITYSMDLSETESISSVFEDLRERGIKLDGLVHCAGMEGSLSPVRSVKQSSLDLLMKLHYEAFVELGRLFYKKTASNEGSGIIVISSLAALMCQKNSIDYSASKAAVNAAVRVMSKEFLKRNIRVNGIMPANVDTPMCDRLKSLVEIETIQPMGMIDPIHIAYLTEFLMSEKARFITGALIPVSAGMEY